MDVLKLDFMCDRLRGMTNVYAQIKLHMYCTVDIKFKTKHDLS